MVRICVSMACLLALSACASSGGPSGAPPVGVRQQQDSYYQAAAQAVSARETERGAPRAKNVILFIGDGMGVSTITAARIWAGQNRGLDGESYRLAMDTLPYSAFAKTYTHDSQVADSAPTAAAMTTGVKSYNGAIGVTQSADIRKCATAETASADSLWEIAEDAGLATGVISTARLTHATPAAAYAKTTERDWENDAQVSSSGKEAGCRDIARQFVDWRHGDGFEVFMGGGRANFLPSSLSDPEYPNQKGARADGRDLTLEWANAGPSRRVVTDLAGFRGVNFDSDVQVLGLFEPSHMQYEADRAKDRAGEPSLADLTRAAMTRLSRNPKGYVLMVEAGRIDHAHHAGNAARALAETAAVVEAVAAAMAGSDPRDTLIIVTADHSHTFVIQGYPGRNNPILGLVTYPDGKGAVRGLDSRPFTTLAYMNGPGSICRISPQGNVCNREDLSNVDTQALDYVQQALIPLPSETHGGEDVAVFARGPGAQLVSGTIEQNEIFHVMARSLRLVR